MILRGKKALVEHDPPLPATPVFGYNHLTPYLFEGLSLAEPPFPVMHALVGYSCMVPRAFRYLC